MRLQQAFSEPQSVIGILVKRIQSAYLYGRYYPLYIYTYYTDLAISHKYTYMQTLKSSLIPF